MPTDPVIPSRDPSPESSSTAQRDTNQSTSGTALAPDEVAEYEQLRRLVSREQSLALLDDFAKWLFPTAAVVGTLGASFGLSSHNTLTGAGQTLFTLAVAFIGASLALAALARLPLPGRVYLFSRESLSSHVDQVVRIRGVLLTAAALFFASALVLASLAPVFG